MARQQAKKEPCEDKTVLLESRSLGADVIYCRYMVLTSLDMLVDMRSNGKDIAEKMTMAIACLDSTMNRLDDILERYT
jgi:hypothetical protein